MVSSRQKKSPFSRWFVEPWRPVTDPVDARNCRLMSLMQLCIMTLGPVIIEGPYAAQYGAPFRGALGL